MSGGENWGLESAFNFNDKIILNKPNYNQEEKYRITQITGLGDADIRDERSASTGHGEHRGSTLYGGRTIVLRGRIEARNAMYMRGMIQDLKQAVSDLDLGEQPLYIEPPNEYGQQNWVPNASVRNISYTSAAVLYAGGTGGNVTPTVTVVADGDGVPNAHRWAGTTRTGGSSNYFNYYMVDNISNKNEGMPLFGVNKVYAGISMKSINAIPSGASFQVHVKWFYANNTSSTELLKSVVNPEQNIWHRIEGSLPVPADATHCMVFASYRGLDPETSYVARTSRAYLTGSDAGYGDENSPFWVLETQSTGVPKATAMRSLRLMVVKNQPLDLDESQNNLKAHREFMLTLRASNPRLTSKFLKSQQMIGSGEISMNIVNDGRYPAQPLIEIQGPFFNSSLVNNTTGEVMSIGTILSTQKIFFDCETKRVWLNSDGSNKASLLNSASDWIHLVPGTNNIQIDMQNPADPYNANVIVHWRDTWI